MTRPKRAAAVRAASSFVANGGGSHSATPEGTPVRSLRRATFRSSRHGARDLKRRRADFERVVKFHQIHLREMKEQQTLDSSLTDDSVQLSQDDVSLTSQWAHDILEESLDPLRNSLRALLLRLQATCNLTEANGSDTIMEFSGKPPSDDEDVRGLAEALVTDRFMSHEGEHVKLLVACCLAEIMRICAPEPPIPERKLNLVCALFIEQLAVLSAKEDPSEPFRFSLLEQLATVKTFLIFSDDDEVICDIFACFYAVVKPHQSDKVKQYCAEILISLLDEADNLSTAALDAMLAPFVSAYGYSEDAIALAARVLHGASSFIQVPLASLLNASIQELHSTHGSSVPRKGGQSRKSPGKRKLEESSESSSKEHSEHHEHIQDLIVAINNVASDVLVYVIPNLEDGLTSKDVTRRVASATLLGRLFTSRAEVANSYPSLFAEFLNRGRDENAEVRASVTTTLGHLMKLHPKHREHIDELFRNRVFDRSESVRIAAVRSIGRAGDGPSDELLKMHATRLRDKKHSIRQTTADAVNELYTSNAQQQESKSSGVDVTQELAYTNDVGNSQNEFGKQVESTTQEASRLLEDLESRTLRLSWLPNTLVESMLAVDGVGDYETGRRIEKIILFDIPSLNCRKPSRVKSGLRQLCIFLSHLSDGAFMSLCTRLRDKWRVRSKLMAIIEYRLSPKRKRQTDQQHMNDVDEITPSSPPQRPQDGENTPSSRSSPQDVERLVVTLAAYVRRRHSIAGDVVAMCKSLSEVADLKCFEALERSISCNSTFQDYVGEKQDALSRAGLTTSAHSFWSDIVLPDCFPGVLSGPFFSYATEIAIAESKEQVDTDPSGAERSLSVLRGLLRFLELFGLLAKEVLVHVTEDIQSLCEVKVDGSVARAEVLLCGLRLASRIPGNCFGKLTDDSFQDKLRSLMVCNKLVSAERGAALAKAAARAAIHLQNGPSESETLSDLGKSLVFELDSFSGDPESIVAPLTALTQFAKYAPRSFKPMYLGCFDFSRGILSGSLNVRIEAAGNKDGSAEVGAPSDMTEETLTPIFGKHTGELSKAITVPEHLFMASVVQQATKLIVYSLPYLEDEELSGVIKVLLNVAFEKRGRVLYTKDEDDSDYEDEDTTTPELSSSKAMYAACRLFAGRAIAYLASHSKFLKSISPDVLSSALLLLQDENASVRMCFAKKICDCIMKKRLPLRWVIGLALMAMDPNRKNIGHVKALLSSVFRQRRRIYDQAKRESHKTSLVLLPEGTVPELIWVLAKLPDVEMDEANGFQESEKCLQLFLDRLLETNEHAGILHEYIESLSIAQDVNEDEDSGPGPCTQRITELGQIAAAILKKKQAGRKWNLAEHPGRVALPRDMFRIVNRKAETSGVQPVSLVQVARRFDEGAQAGSAKKKPADVVLDPELSSAERKKKGSSTPKQGRLQRTSGGSTRGRSSEKKRPSRTRLESRISEETESPPKRPRISHETDQVVDQKEAEDSELRDSPLTGRRESAEKLRMEEDKTNASNNSLLKDRDASEDGSRQQTAVSSGRKEQVKKRPRATKRSGAACTLEANAKLTRVRRSARNRGP